MRKYMMAHPILFFITMLMGIFAQGAGTLINFFIMFIIDSITAGNMQGLIMAAWMGVGVVVFFFLALYGFFRTTVAYSYKTVLR
ncbi:MAG: hypothetical protein FWE34_04450 [Defluviitaleaceae bacterium]|nr:hypothetical protein [Defluviitaleaceae bacterium]